MPRKAKLIAVPVEQKEEEVASGGDDEVKTDAQEMTEIINEVKVEEPVSEPIADASVPEPKPKAKARAKREPKKPVEVEPVVEVSVSLDEVEADVRLPTASELKMETKVPCPECGKQMSAKTLRYSHGPNCQAKKHKQNEEPIDHSVIEEVIENEVQKRLNNSRAQRALRRQETVEKLMQNAF